MWVCSVLHVLGLSGRETQHRKERVWYVEKVARWSERQPYVLHCAMSVLDRQTRES